MDQRRRTALLAALAAIIIAGAYTVYTVYGSGRLAVSVTDPPRDWGDASNVYIRFSEVRVHRANVGNETGWVTIVEEGGWVDLGSTLNSSAALGTGSLQAGKYNLVWFTVEEAIVTVDGANHTAAVQSGVLKVSIFRGGVDIKAGQTSYLLIDMTPRVNGSAAEGFRVVPAAKALPTQS
jgi:hypothetical protein